MYITFFLYNNIILLSSIVRTHLPENYSEAAWFKLKEAVLAVYNSSPISYSLEELYKAVENSCSHGMAAQLYGNLTCVCRDHITSLLPQFNSYPLLSHFHALSFYSNFFNLL